MKTYRLVISSPDGDLYNGEAVSFSARGVEGELAILADHVPFVTAIKAGKCVVELENEIKKEARTDGGILTVSKEKTVFLSGTFEWIE